jgi:hypothetical protein
MDRSFLWAWRQDSIIVDLVNYYAIRSITDVIVSSGEAGASDLTTLSGVDVVEGIVVLTPMGRPSQQL